MVPDHTLSLALKCLLLLSLLHITTPLPTTTIIHTKLGNVRSNVLSNGVVESLNIPFAEAPVRQLRFAPSRPPTPWSPTILDGTKFGPMCIQTSAILPIDEDCLQLNVWAPPPRPPPPPTSTTTTTTAARAAPPSLLPVFFWVFGGGLTSGSGIQYNGTALALSGDVIVVTINYRLAALGFYASESIGDATINTTGAMNGVLDVVRALKFVHNHIR